MASDAELLEDVIEELRSEAMLRCEKIGVRVSLGVVTLTGYVANYARKRQADHAVGRVPGVRSFVSEIAVKRDGLVIAARGHASNRASAQSAVT
jgi:osmotically-inducible protein OsmY